MKAIGFMLSLDRLALLVERLGGPQADEAPAARVQGLTLGDSVRDARARRARGEKVLFGGDR